MASLAPSEAPELDDVLDTYARALNDNDELGARSAETEFACRFWQPSTTELINLISKDKYGILYRIHRRVALGLGLPGQGHDSAMNWMVWASDLNDVGEYWLARSCLAEDEALRFNTYLCSGGMESAPDSDIPLISRMVKELRTYEPLLHDSADVSPKRRALVEALLRVEHASMSVRRSDLAAELQKLVRHTLSTVSKRYQPLLEHYIALMDARDLHFHGEIVEAARLCAAWINDESDQTVMMALRMRQNLADYSVETEHYDTAARMLHNNLMTAASRDLKIDYCTAARALCTVANTEHDENSDELHAIVEGALAQCASLPECPLIMELRLELASLQLQQGQAEKALPLAQQVANWSSTTKEFSRTARACEIAASAALEQSEYDYSAQLYTDLAGLRETHMTSLSALETLCDAAAALAQHGAPEHSVDELMRKAESYIHHANEKAQWLETTALIHWGRWDDNSARTYAEQAGQKFLSLGAPADAARALTIAASAATSAGENAAAEEYARQVESLVPTGHPILQQLKQAMGASQSPDK